MKNCNDRLSDGRPPSEDGTTGNSGLIADVTNRYELICREALNAWHDSRANRARLAA